MVKSVQTFYDMNQIMITGRVSKDRPDLQERLDGIPRIKLNTIRQLFLDFLRVPDYVMCLSGSGTRTVMLTQLISMVRSGEMTTNELGGWIPAMIHQMKVTVNKSPKIVDGVLYVPEAMVSGDYDFEADLNDMFCLRCWGALEPNEYAKQLVMFTDNYFGTMGDAEATANLVESFIDLCVQANVHPQDLAKTAILVPDLSYTVKKFGIPAFWADNTHTNVSVVIPRGKSPRVAKIPMSKAYFAELHGNDGYVTNNMFAKGNSVMVPVVGKPGEFTALC